MKAGWDIIGDVHGRDRALLTLCKSMGYDEWGRHPDKRKLIFIGDLLNKGPHQIRLIRRIQAWVEAGRAEALMGNHELEALAWTQRNNNGTHLLPHTPANRARHAAHLHVRKKNPFDYRRQLDFFAARPLWLDMGEFRCVHACWDADSIEYLSRKLGPTATLTTKTLRKAFTEGHKQQQAVDMILRGPRLILPKKARRNLSALRGKPISDVRMRWWLSEDADMAALAIVKARTPKSLKGRAVKQRISYTDNMPVFFGHYHLKDKPYLTASNAACLDFGAGSGRYLTAYRWSGESMLSDKRLVKVKI